MLSDFGFKNYGNRLQSYAVLSILRERGVTGVVAVPCEGSLRWHIKDIVKRLLPSRLWSQKHRYNCFRQFAKKHTPYKLFDLNRFDDLATRFDCLVIGSDQVWSPSFLRRWSNPSAFFAASLPPDKKIALSPSIGLPDIPTEFEEIYRAGLQSFARLSVREDKGAQIISRVANRDADVLADPTIAVRADEWRALANYDLCPDENYVLTYYLGDGLTNMAQRVLDYAGERSLRIIDLMDKEDKFYSTGPAEFIGLIDRASYVVTDSFHGTVFSMLLHTPFSVIPRTGTIGEEMFSRIETLANKFNCWDRVLGSASCGLATDGICWEAVDELVEIEREKILVYVEEELARCGLSETPSSSTRA